MKKITILLLFLIVFSSSILAQDFPDQLYELQKSLNGFPDVIIESISLEQLPFFLENEDETSSFYTNPPVKIVVVVRNQGDAPAIGNFELKIDSNEEGRNKERKMGLYQLIQRTENGINQLVPLTIHHLNGNMETDLPLALDIFNGNIRTISNTKELEQEIEKSSIFFYQLQSGDALRFSFSPQFNFEAGKKELIASISGLVSDVNLENNIQTRTIDYNPQYYMNGPFEGNQQIPYLAEDEIFVFSQIDKCVPAILNEFNLKICVDDAGLFFADVIINEQKIHFGFFNKIFNFKKIINIDENNLKLIVYHNGIKISNQ